MYNEYLNENIEVINIMKQKEDVFEKFNKMVIKCLNNNNKIILIGNGGSAVDSMHIAAEFVARFKIERNSLPAIALTSNSAIITAIANDYHFNNIFSRQLESIGNRGDLLIALTTSGNSINILNAIDMAQKMNISTVVISGNKNIKCDLNINIPSNDTSIIQNIYMIYLHLTVGYCERRLANENSN